MIIDELLGRHAVDLIHKALLVGEEVVELVGQPPTEGDTALVTLVQILHHWAKTVRGTIYRYDVHFAHQHKITYKVVLNFHFILVPRLNQATRGFL